jgi:putative endonuclease
MDSEKTFCVYIMASKSRVIYIGVTGFLYARVLQHKQGEVEGFTKRYRITRLVYFERHKYINNAIARETELKGWSRPKKVALIEQFNPTWKDLAADWGKPFTMEKQIPRFARNGKSQRILAPKKEKCLRRSS